MEVQWLARAALCSLAGALTVVGCGDSPRAPASHHVPSHAAAKDQPATVRHAVALGADRHVAPPAGVRAQLSWIVGGGSSFMADCSGEFGAAPRVAFSRLPYNGEADGSSARPLLGESFAVCVTGLPGTGAIDLTMTRPDGQIVRARRSMPTESHSTIPSETRVVTWYPPFAAVDPAGRYVVDARQGRVEVSGWFVARAPRRPAFRATRFFGVPGATYPVEVVGLRPGQHVRLVLYRDRDFAPAATFAASADAVAGRSGTVVYLARTSRRDSPRTCYGADVRVDGRELSGAGGVGEFCLQPENG